MLFPGIDDLPDAIPHPIQLPLTFYHGVVAFVRLLLFVDLVVFHLFTIPSFPLFHSFPFPSYFVAYTDYYLPH